MNNQYLVNTIIGLPLQNYKNRQFKIVSHLGNGAQGLVVKVLAQNWDEKKNGQYFAAKLQSQMTDQEYSFLNGLKIWQEQNEQSIGTQNHSIDQLIRIYDCTKWNDYYVQILEYGTEDLYQYLQNNNPNYQEKGKICLQVVWAINQLHCAGTFHRDIKPENYIHVNGKFKLTDFGLIKSIQNNFNATQTKKVGSLLFLAPEMLSVDQYYTSSVDIWSLGCVIYEIINKQALFDSTSQEQLVQKIQNYCSNQIPTFQKIDQLNISKSWKDIIKLMLNPNPQQRPTAFTIFQILRDNKIEIQLTHGQLMKKNEQTVNEVPLRFTNQNFIQQKQQQQQQQQQQNNNNLPQNNSNHVISNDNKAQDEFYLENDDGVIDFEQDQPIIEVRTIKTNIDLQGLNNQKLVNIQFSISLGESKENMNESAFKERITKFIKCLQKLNDKEQEAMIDHFKEQIDEYLKNDIDVNNNKSNQSAQQSETNIY